MQQVSQAYKDSMRNSTRMPSHMEISYSVISDYAKQQAILADNGHTYYSSLDIKTDHAENDYITFEPGRWRVGSSSLILPETHSDETTYNSGFVSHVISDENGDFTVYPVISIAFEDEQEFYGFTLTFDDANNEYPAHIQIEYVNLDDEIITVDFYPNSAEYVCDIQIIDATNVQIRFLNSGLPYRRARLKKIMFGRQLKFTNSEITSASFTSSVDPISTSISNKSLTFSIDNSKQVYNPFNPTGLLRYMEEKQPISVRFGYEISKGNIEWLPSEDMVLLGTPLSTDMETTFSASDIFNSEGRVFYKGLYRPEGITLYDLAVEVLTDAGYEQGDYIIDNHLKSIITKGALPIVTHKECLQIIANAGQCIIFIERTGKIRFEIALEPQVTISDNGHVWFSTPDSAFNDSALPEIRYLDFLPGSWPVGNDALVPLPEKKEEIIRTGFISEEICGEDMTFSKRPKYTLTYSFEYSSYSLPIVFDAILEEYATDFLVNYYSGKTLIDSYHVTGNSSSLYTVEYNVAGMDIIEFVIIKWSKPYRRARITKIGLGRINDYHLKAMDMMGSYPAVDKQSLAKSITVNTYNYAPKPEISEIYKEDIALENTRRRRIRQRENVVMEINHDGAVDLSASVSGDLTLVSEQHYTYRSVIVLSGTSGELIINGRELVETSTSIINEINSRGEEKEALTNPLITDVENAQLTAEWLGTYFSKRNHMTVSYRGNPELDCYDTIYMETRFEEYVPARIMELGLEFNGAITGTMKAVVI